MVVLGRLSLRSELFIVLVLVIFIVLGLPIPNPAVSARGYSSRKRIVAE
jgi:hypothetical protein